MWYHATRSSPTASWSDQREQQRLPRPLPSHLRRRQLRARLAHHWRRRIGSHVHCGVRTMLPSDALFRTSSIGKRRDAARASYAVTKSSCLNCLQSRGLTKGTLLRKISIKHDETVWVLRLGPYLGPQSPQNLWLSPINIIWIHNPVSWAFILYSWNVMKNNAIVAKRSSRQSIPIHQINWYHESLYVIFS